MAYTSLALFPYAGSSASLAVTWITEVPVRETDRLLERQTGCQRDRQRDRQAVRETDRLLERQTVRETGRLSERQTGC